MSSHIDKMRKEALEQLVVVSSMNKFTQVFYTHDEFLTICGLFLDAVADRTIDLGRQEGMTKDNMREMTESLINEINKLVKTYTNVDLGSFDNSGNSNNQHNT